MTRLLFILLLAVGISLGPAPAWAGEPFMAPDGTAYPDGVQAVLTEARAAYDAEDFQRAHALWLPLAEAGNAEAQYRVGRLYDVGEGFTRNGPEAVKWYTLASDQAHQSATHNLSNLFRDGEIVSQDHVKAFRLFEINAMRGHTLSQANLGLAFLVGRGVEPDLVEGYKWLLIAERNGWTDGKAAVTYFRDFISFQDIKNANKQAISSVYWKQ